MENERKVCRTCKFGKSKKEFSITQFDNKNSECKNCVSAYNKKYYEENTTKIVESNITHKICKTCKIEKVKEEFGTSQFNSTNSQCRNCNSIFDNLKRIKNQEEQNKNNILHKICRACGFDKSKEEFSYTEYNRKNSKCKDCIKIYNGKYREDNKEKTSVNAKCSYQENRVEILEKVKLYNELQDENDKQKRKEYHSEYNKKNRDTKNKNEKLKKQSDLAYNLWCSISSAINEMLKINGGSKLGSSKSKYLPYTSKELVEYLEKQFIGENSWMNWNNRGKYDSKSWDDNDKSTWKWQLDHIIPKSEFNCDSMNHPDFQKCWGLSNLRPLSAKQNIRDGSTRVRHSKNN